MRFKLTSLEDNNSTYSALTPLAKAIKGIISLIDHKNARSHGIVKYIEYFDLELARKYNANKLSINENKQVGLILKLLGKEYEFLYIKNQSFYENIMQGNFANSIYDVRVAEEERNRKAKVAKREAWALALAGAASSVTSSTGNN